MEQEKKEEVVNNAEDMVSKALKAAERLEQANKRNEEILAKNEQLVTRMILSGNAQAGSAVKPLSEEEKVKLEANDFLKKAGLRLNEI